MTLTEQQPVTVVAGIGDKKAAFYRKLGIQTVGELLRHAPRDYLDLTRAADPEQCVSGTPALLRAVVTAKSREQRIRKGLSIWKVQASCEGFPLLLTFYNTKYAVEALKPDGEYLFYGIMTKTLLRCEMSSPMVLTPDDAGGLLPVYPATAGLSSRVIGRDIRRALLKLKGMEDSLPAGVLEEYGLLPLPAALKSLHSPQSWEEAQRARERFSFEELLVTASAMQLLRGTRERRSTARMEPAPLGQFYAAMPFGPTGAQRRAAEQIQEDLCSGRLMNRLIQGDVGSGKTMVAAAAIWMVCRNGYQAAMMAPTELLAKQHADTLTGMLAPLGLRVLLVTGSMGMKARREAAGLIASGEADVIVGTHALLFGETEYSRLGLVITDEQHRFGVAQRAALSAKGQSVHTLVMSATPIPRTLSLLLYGDLDLSVLDELPPGRTPVATYRIDSSKRARAFGFVRRHLDEGRQAYLVCPLVEEGEQSTEGLIPAAEYAPKLAAREFAGYRVGLLHGKMRPAAKQEVMRQFLEGEIQLLVATTVVEVGVDVPNAAVMVIENAERFGLSQLHQLRGRVGRGEHPSSCILISDAKGELTRQRLKALCETNDGFRIAEEDLRLRGPGDILGVRQHGSFGLSSGVPSPELPQRAAQAARELLARDPLLEDAAHAGLANAVHRLLSEVGERLN